MACRASLNSGGECAVSRVKRNWEIKTENATGLWWRREPEEWHKRHHDDLKERTVNITIALWLRGSHSNSICQASAWAVKLGRCSPFKDAGHRAIPASKRRDCCVHKTGPAKNWTHKSIPSQIFAATGCYRPKNRAGKCPEATGQYPAYRDRPLSATLTLACPTDQRF